MKKIAVLFFLTALLFGFGAFLASDQEYSIRTETSTRHFNNGSTDQDVISTESDSFIGFVVLSFGIISSTCFLSSALLFMRAYSIENKV